MRATTHKLRVSPSKFALQCRSVLHYGFSFDHASDAPRTMRTKRAPLSGCALALRASWQPPNGVRGIFAIPIYSTMVML